MSLEASFELDVDEPRELVIVVLRGPVGPNEFLTGFQRMLAHPGYHPGMRILVDMLQHVHQVDTEGMRQIAQAFVGAGESLRGSAVAVVVARAVSYGMLRMLQIMVSDVPFALSVFYERTEAEKALGLN